LKRTGLYIHFPFCRRACFYCHFFKKKFQAEKAHSWLRLVRREIGLRSDAGVLVDTVYLGGGSPSLLDPGQIAALLEAAAKHFRLSDRAEVTLEANPEDLSIPWLEELRSVGINRLSIGVQSFQEKDLRCLKRNHSAAQAARAVEMALRAGFANISLDLIIGLESQTSQSMKSNFRTIEEFKPAHVSVYILEGVPSKRPSLGEVKRQAADERDARLYFLARRCLCDLGYEHYEVSNYCLPGNASRHNLKYWRNQPYIGLGAAAAGYLDGRDYRNYPDLGKYRASLEKGALPEQKIPPLQPARRRVATGLRLLDGISAAALAPFSAPRDFLLAEGFLVRRGARIAVAADKILLLNEILGYLI
jgi:oxygen-independent coproporphyrinogen-3 oxidase